MEWFTILKDEKTNRRLLQVDLSEVAKNEDLLEDLFDKIALEIRKQEESINWEDAKSALE